jgi:hypothetical protein
MKIQYEQTEEEVERIRAALNEAIKNFSPIPGVSFFII